MKKIKETEQYCNAKNRILPKPSPKRIRTKERYSKFVKVKQAKPQCRIMLNKINCKQKRLYIQNSREKDKNY